MAESKKTGEKKPRKRRATAAKCARASKAKEPRVDEPAACVASSEKAVLEEPVLLTEEPPVSKEAAKGMNADAELRKAEELLQSNGYLLVPYRKTGRKIGRFVGAGVGFVKDAGKGLCGWIAKKHAAMKVRREENRRVAAEKKRLADEAARRAEIAKTERRLAELRAEEARIKADSVSSTVVQSPAEPVEQPAPEPVVQPVPEPVEQPIVEPVSQPVPVESVEMPESEPIAQPAAKLIVTEEIKETEVASSVDSDVPKCAACGAELTPKARFCRKCGKPIAAPVEVPSDSGFPKCVACGAELVPEMRFCRKCGKPIVASAPSV